MAIPSFVTAVFLLAVAVVVATARVGHSTTHILKGKVVCLDCDATYDLSGTLFYIQFDSSFFFSLFFSNSICICLRLLDANPTLVLLSPYKLT